MILRYVFAGVVAACFSISSASSQGCVAVRPMSCSGGGGSANSSGLLMKNQLQAGLNYRYLESYKHFRGDKEEHERVELGTQVINTVHTADMSLAYAATSRLTVTFNLPITHYDRSSLYEHYGNSLTANPEQKRFRTGAFGPGDARLTASYWLFDPAKHQRGNASIGLGIKMPTGDANVQDEFHRRLPDARDSVFMRAVDQSIQLGDGGWGFSLETQMFQSIYGGTFVYANAYYLFNPRNTNATITRGTLINVNPIIAYHSVADQYAARAGVGQLLWPKYLLSLTAGGRIEGVPAYDLIGGSNGFRRPGYVVAIEPGLSAQFRQWTFNTTVPYAMYRNRIKSVYDRADINGERHGDAAFADYSVNVGIAYRFGGVRPHAGTE